MKIMKKLAIVLFVSVLCSCATLDTIMSFFTGDESYTGGSDEKTSISSNKTSVPATQKAVISYKTPDSYEKAYSYRTGKADKRVREFIKKYENMRASSPNEYVKKVCEDISNSAANDFEKVKMAHDFVALLISYDAASFWSGSLPDQEWQNVFKTKLAVCEGYSNALKKVCDVLTIPCTKVHGYARGVGTSIITESKSYQSNHAWNIVQVEGDFYFIDSTWDSGYMEGKISKQSYNTEWLFIKPEHFIYSHYPDNKKEQMLKKSLSFEEFLNLPDFRPKLFECANFEKNIAKLENCNGKFEIVYDFNEDYTLSFRVLNSANNMEVKNSYFIKNEEKKTTALFAFPKEGLYLIDIFYTKKNAKQGMGCGQFAINSSAGSNVKYPQIYDGADGAYIVEPVEMPLKKGSKVLFTVFSPNKKFVTVIAGKNYIKLKNDGNNRFSGEVSITNNISSVKIGISDKETGSMAVIADYTVK